MRRSIWKSDESSAGSARIKMRRAAYAKIHEILRDIEREWGAELGPKRFTGLKELLLRVWESPLTR